jgi:hypothetical protein
VDEQRFAPSSHNSHPYLADAKAAYQVWAHQMGVSISFEWLPDRERTAWIEVAKQVEELIEDRGHECPTCGVFLECPECEKPVCPDCYIELICPVCKTEVREPSTRHPESSGVSPEAAPLIKVIRKEGATHA